MEEVLKDERFAHVARDPKFRRIPKGERKVKIDKRFQSMFEDKKFAVKYTVDKRGRPVNQSSKENLKKYYDLQSDEETEPKSINGEQKKSKLKISKDIDLENKSKKVSKKNCNNQINNEPNEIEKEVKPSMKRKSKLKKHEDSDKETETLENSLLFKLKPDNIEESRQNTESEDSAENDNTEEDIEDDNSDDISNEDNNESSSMNSYENKNQLKLKEKDDQNELSEVVKKKLRDLRVDYARGEGVLFSDSSSSEEEDSEDDDNQDQTEEVTHDWGEFDKDADPADKVTNRLAVCNMDCDRIRAVDLMVLFNSFLPRGHLIHSVTIYPSEFGLQRMKEEEIKGPKELVELEPECLEEANNDCDENEEEGSSYQREKLRQYQINRLKYFYAVVVFDSPETAEIVYNECDGTEYELTGTKLDLRVISDETTFDEEPKEVCNQLPDLSKYAPRQFTTTALQQVKVDLTWDETDPYRSEVFEKLNAGKFEDLDQNLLRNYLASGSSDEESEHEVKDSDIPTNEKKMSTIEKYKALLKSIEDEEEKQKNDKKMEFEVTWDVEAKEKAQQLVKDGIRNSEELTPFEKFVEKRNEKRKKKREEKKKSKAEEIDDSESEDLPSDVDMNDPYFAEEIQSIKKSSKKRKVYEVEEKPEAELEKAELELLLMDKNEENKKHFNMKKIEEVETMSKSKKKRLEKKNKIKIVPKDDFEIDVKDPRFAALYTSHHFNIDPSDSHYRNTKGTSALVEEKLRKRKQEDNENELHNDIETGSETQEKKSENTELSALVKSVKRKMSNFKKK